jgi:hypothetical protein
MRDVDQTQISQTKKGPDDDWTTGNELMTAAQKSYLKNALLRGRD